MSNIESMGNVLAESLLTLVTEKHVKEDELSKILKYAKKHVDDFFEKQKKDDIVMAFAYLLELLHQNDSCKKLFESEEAINISGTKIQKTKTLSKNSIIVEFIFHDVYMTFKLVRMRSLEKNDQVGTYVYGFDGDVQLNYTEYLSTEEIEEALCLYAGKEFIPTNNNSDNDDANENSENNSSPSVRGQIIGFYNNYTFLRNDYDAPVYYQGIEYRNNEAAYQASKCTSNKQKIMFKDVSALEAKRMGSSIPVGSCFEEEKCKIMYDICCCKFDQNKELASKLLDTGNAELIAEGAGMYWGSDHLYGENRLGKILMKVREQLRNRV